MDKRFYTVAEAAESLAVSKRWIANEIKNQRLKSIKTRSKRLIASAELDAYVELLIKEDSEAS